MKKSRKIKVVVAVVVVISFLREREGVNRVSDGSYTRDAKLGLDQK